LVSLLTVLAGICALIQLFFWYSFFNRLSKISVKDPSDCEFNPVSVVICAKNAAEDLKLNLPTILAQSYPEFEILLIDDNSEDDTANTIHRMQQKERYLNYRKINKNIAGKKGALADGIANSRHSWLLLTDADCLPKSANWIKSMLTSAQSDKAKIILGYSPYANDGSILQSWVHFEAWLTGVQYLSFAVKGLPYMGVGRNLLYNKTLIKPENISKHSDLASGDDDLTIQEIANATNTSICLSPSSFVETQPAKNWLEYFKQKRRHFSTGHRYKFIHKFLLSSYSLSQVLFYVLLVLLIIKQAYLIALGLYFTRLILILPVANNLIRKLGSSLKLWSYPLFDFGQSLFYILFSFSVLLPQKNKW